MTSQREELELRRSTEIHEIEEVFSNQQKKSFLEKFTQSFPA